jgi:chromate reductase, NAD(P)H dehydrogenase (quinone)
MMKKVLAISGSTRLYSTNLNYIKAVSELAADFFSVEVFEGLMHIPPFNRDDNNDDPPAVIKDFRNRLKEADGILICTPEYAMGVPGTLKNAIDWTVSSMEFSQKPVALITASLSGLKGHAALLETLHVIESKMTAATGLVISFAKTKISHDYKITDEATLREVKKLIEAFSVLMQEEPVNSN